MNTSKPPQEGYAGFAAYQTWYRVTGDLHNGLTPLVLLHAGSSRAHETLAAFQDVAASGRAIVQYDHLAGSDSSCWTLELLLQELDNLLDHLRISDNYALLGQSWGGVLAAEHGVLAPAGLRALIIANAPADMHTWQAETRCLRETLPEEVLQTLLLHEQAGTLRSAEYRQASQVFFERHICRLRPWPEEVTRMLALGRYVFVSGGEDQEAAAFPLLSSLQDWTVVERLAGIKAPTLLISGRHDLATPRVVMPYLEQIADIRWALFEHSSHMPHIEERVACMGTVVSFLDQCL